VSTLDDIDPDKVLIGYPEILPEHSFIVDGLAQGSFPSYTLDMDVPWNLIISLSRQPRKHNVPYIHFPFDDGYVLPDTYVLDDLATMAAKRVKAGMKVLVHCDAGLNRSGLVTGLALVKLGYKPDDALFLMRKKRCAEVLHNTVFRKHLLEQA